MNIHTQTVINKTWNPPKGAFEYSFTFAFCNKAQYLEFRGLWKESYALLSIALRAQKALIKSTMRERQYAGAFQSQLLALKSEATMQLSMLRTAKQEANRQYQAKNIPTDKG